MAKALRKSNPGLVALIQELKRAARESGARIWSDIAKRLSKPRANWAEVNLSRLERHASEGDVLVIPGKLLGAGELSKAIKVAAFTASNAARQKVEAAGGKFMDIRQLIHDNPKGSGVRIMG